MIVVNKHTVELARKDAELAHKKCRLVILGVIKREKNLKWKQKYIETLTNCPLTEDELKFVNS